MYATSPGAAQSGSGVNLRITTTIDVNIELCIERLLGTILQ